MGQTGSSDRERALQKSLEVLQRRLDACQKDTTECATSKQYLGERVGASNTRVRALEQELQQCALSRRSLDDRVNASDGRVTELEQKLGQCSNAQRDLEEQLKATGERMGGLQKDLGRCALDNERLWQGPRSQALAVLKVAQDRGSTLWVGHRAVDRTVKHLAPPAGGTAVVTLRELPPFVAAQNALLLRLVDLDRAGTFVLEAAVPTGKEGGPPAPVVGYLGIDQEDRVALRSEQQRWTATLWLDGVVLWTWSSKSKEPAAPNLTVVYADLQRGTLKTSARPDPFDADLIAWSPRA